MDIGVNAGGGGSEPFGAPSRFGACRVSVEGRWSLELVRSPISDLNLRAQLRSAQLRSTPLHPRAPLRFAPRGVAPRRAP